MEARPDEGEERGPELGRQDVLRLYAGPVLPALSRKEGARAEGGCPAHGGGGRPPHHRCARGVPGAAGAGLPLSWRVARERGRIREDRGGDPRGDRKGPTLTRVNARRPAPRRGRTRRASRNAT